MKQKKTNKLLSLLLTAVLVMVLCFAALASTSENASAKTFLSYTVRMNPAGEGQLYWNYGKNMEFFILNGNSFNRECLVGNGTSCRFSSLVDRSVIPVASEGWYFDGFYDKSGKKISLKSTNIDIIRLTVKGIYFYDCIPSYDNPQYSRYTEKAYKEEMKTLLKAMYGIKTYKVMNHGVMYRLPKEDKTYYPLFKEKKAPSLPGKLTLEKSLNDPDFYAAGKKNFTASYSSSCSKVIKVDKTTGLAQITGPGKATVTVRIPATETSLSAVYKVNITVNPVAVTDFSASRTRDKKYVAVKWKADSRCSGYEVEISNSKSFSEITAKKTVTSGKTASTKVSCSKTANCRYARIRPYKTSGGKRLYGSYTVCTVK